MRVLILVILLSTSVHGLRKNLLIDWVWNVFNPIQDPLKADVITTQCRFANGTLFKNATNCGDSLPNCAESYDVSKHNKPFPNCNDLETRDLALKCAKTCGICCLRKK